MTAPRALEACCKRCQSAEAATVAARRLAIVCMVSTGLATLYDGIADEPIPDHLLRTLDALGKPQ